MPLPPKRPKLFNDPVHGFIEVPQGLLLMLIDHPYVQRLRRIRQTGASEFVYPGATHSRFSHALGAFHLTQQALAVLQRKGIDISDAEAEATLATILLHDLGHGPFSHALESVLLPGVPHEQLSRQLMHKLNEELGGQLDLALRIFDGRHPKRFLHALISSQLDMDRMDYLLRDSFFTGVSEGIIGTDRIIKTLNVVGGRLVVEHKGIYSVEKFIVARRLMYWQVYLHKTSLSAEYLLVHLLHRARSCYLVHPGSLWMNEPLEYLFALSNSLISNHPPELLQHFTALDDHDLTYALKQWCHSQDGILADLSQRLLGRRLLKLRFRPAPATEEDLAAARVAAQAKWKLPTEALPYYVFAGQVSNLAYLSGSEEPILILYPDGSLQDLITASDLSTLGGFTQTITKNFLVTPG